MRLIVGVDICFGIYPKVYESEGDRPLEMEVSQIKNNSPSRGTSLVTTTINPGSTKLTLLDRVHVHNIYYQTLLQGSVPIYIPLEFSGDKATHNVGILEKDYHEGGIFSYTKGGPHKV